MNIVDRYRPPFSLKGTHMSAELDRLKEINREIKRLRQEYTVLTKIIVQTSGHNIGDRVRCLDKSWLDYEGDIKYIRCKPSGELVVTILWQQDRAGNPLQPSFLHYSQFSPKSFIHI